MAIDSPVGLILMLFPIMIWSKKGPKEIGISCLFAIKVAQIVKIL